MDTGATYRSVRTVGIQLEKAYEAQRKKQQRPRRPWAPPVKVSLKTPSKPVRLEQLPTGAQKPIDNLDWDTRGKVRAKAFVVAALEGDPAKMKDAFYDPEFGKNPKL